MGLGPIQAIYQARFMKYLASRGLIDAAKAEQRKVWAGPRRRRDRRSRIAGRHRHGRPGKTRQPGLRHQLQPAAPGRPGARGNGKIIQELESGIPRRRLERHQAHLGPLGQPLRPRQQGHPEEAHDGTGGRRIPDFKAKNGAYVREHFFNTPELKALVADWTDDEVWQLNRGGHDIFKIFAAYDRAVKHKGQPTLILAKTIKGFGMGDAGEAMNISHQQKKMDHEQIKRSVTASPSRCR